MITLQVKIIYKSHRQLYHYSHFLVHFVFVSLQKMLYNIFLMMSCFSFLKYSSTVFTWLYPLFIFSLSSSYKVAVVAFSIILIAVLFKIHDINLSTLLSMPSLYVLVVSATLTPCMRHKMVQGVLGAVVPLVTRCVFPLTW